MEFSLKLKELRERCGLSQAALAKELGVGVGSVGMWESTDRIPPARKLVKIANYFNVTTDYLLGREDTFDNIVINSNDGVIRLSSLEQQLVVGFRKLTPASQNVVVTLVNNMASTPA